MYLLFLVHVGELAVLFRKNIELHRNYSYSKQIIWLIDLLYQIHWRLLQKWTFLYCVIKSIQCNPYNKWAYFDCRRQSTPTLFGDGVSTHNLNVHIYLRNKPMVVPTIAVMEIYATKATFSSTASLDSYYLLL